jgi:hypothetical protein
MVGEPSHVKQLSLNQVCKIGLKRQDFFLSIFRTMHQWTPAMHSNTGFFSHIFAVKKSHKNGDLIYDMATKFLLNKDGPEFEIY